MQTLTVTYTLNDEQIKMLNNICYLYKQTTGKDKTIEEEFNFIMTRKSWGGINSKLQWYYDVLLKNDVPF